MRYAYYESCSLPEMGKEYQVSLQYCCQKLNIELVKLQDWMCCGSTMTHHNSRLLATALPMRNLMAAQKAGFDTMVVPCSACYARMKTAQHEYQTDSRIKAQIEEILEYQFSRPVRVIHPLELFSDPEVLAKIKTAEKTKIGKIKVASYYGCLLVRPPQTIGFGDDTEYPMNMDTILQAAGYKTVDWSYKTECCGGYFTTVRPGWVKEMSLKVFDNAKACGAEVIANPCIFCQTNLDTRQKAIEKEYRKQYGMPVVYFTQLLALALGATYEEMLFKYHFVSPREVAQKVVSHDK